MQFKILEKKENVKCYTTYKSKIAMLFNNGNFFYENENLVHSFEGFFFYDNYLYYTEDGINTIMLNINNNEKEIIPKVFNIDSLLNNTFLVGKNYERVHDTLYYSAEIEMYQISPFKLLNILPEKYIFSQYIRYGNFLFTEKFKTVLSPLSLETGEYLWETQLNRNGEVFKILGIRADELIVCWKRGNMDFGLLGINIHTGEIDWNMDDNDLLNGYTLNFSPDENALFCVKNSGFKSYYLELDLLTKKTLRFDEIPKFFELGLIIERIWVKENLIYFFARKGSKFSTVAGIMDYKTLEILWQEQIVVGSWAYLSDLQVDYDKLYILDGEGVLHIFEREASE